MAMPLTEFQDALYRHDWQFQYSDDHHVWERGHNRQRELERIAEQSLEHQALFDAWSDYAHDRSNVRPVLHETKVAA